MRKDRIRGKDVICVNCGKKTLVPKDALGFFVCKKCQHIIGIGSDGKLDKDEFRTGQWAQSAKHLESLYERVGGPRLVAIAWLEIGEILCDEYHLEDEALKAFDAALYIDPSLSRALLYKAAILSNKEPERALKICEKSLRLNPNQPRSWGLKAQIMKRLGNTAEEKKSMGKYRSAYKKYIAQSEKLAEKLRTGELLNLNITLEEETKLSRKFKALEKKLMAYAKEVAGFDKDYQRGDSTFALLPTGLLDKAIATLEKAVALIQKTPSSVINAVNKQMSTEFKHKIVPVGGWHEDPKAFLGLLQDLKQFPPFEGNNLVPKDMKNDFVSSFHEIVDIIHRLSIKAQVTGKKSRDTI